MTIESSYSVALTGFGNGELTDNGVDISLSPTSYSLDDVSATPLPGALPLFATGLGAMGLFGWRRKRKKSAALAGV